MSSWRYAYCCLYALSVTATPSKTSRHGETLCVFVFALHVLMLMPNQDCEFTSNTVTITAGQSPHTGFGGAVWTLAATQVQVTLLHSLSFASCTRDPCMRLHTCTVMQLSAFITRSTFNDNGITTTNFFVAAPIPVGGGDLALTGLCYTICCHDRVLSAAVVVRPLHRKEVVVNHGSWSSDTTATLEDVVSTSAFLAGGSASGGSIFGGVLFLCCESMCVLCVRLFWWFVDMCKYASPDCYIVSRTAMNNLYWHTFFIVVSSSTSTTTQFTLDSVSVTDVSLTGQCAPCAGGGIYVAGIKDCLCTILFFSLSFSHYDRIDVQIDWSQRFFGLPTISFRVCSIPS